MAFRKVHELKEVTISYSSTGPAAFQLYTDVPGPTLAIRLPISAPVATGIGITAGSALGTANRLTQTIPLDGIRATEFYPMIKPATTTQIEIYSMVIQVRPIGVFVDGSTLPVGEIWQTVPIAPGAGGGGGGGG